MQGPISIEAAAMESPAPNPASSVRFLSIWSSPASSEQIVTGRVAELELP